jgi:hypothetical protein
MNMERVNEQGGRVRPLSRLLRVGLFTLLALGAMTMSGYVWVSSSDEAFMRDMRLAKKQNPFAMELKLDEVVLKHIPLGTPTDVAFGICQKNGLETSLSSDVRGATYQGFEEYIFCSREKQIWYLLALEEYRVIIYIKNNRVGAVIGRYFLHTL